MKNNVEEGVMLLNEIGIINKAEKFVSYTTEEFVHFKRWRDYSLQDGNEKNDFISNFKSCRYFSFI